MSKVISFRLNPDNPRKAEALLKLGTPIPDTGKDKVFEDILCRVNEIAEIVSGEISTPNKKDKLAQNEKISINFTDSIINSAKPGLTVKT